MIGQKTAKIFIGIFLLLILIRSQAGAGQIGGDSQAKLQSARAVLSRVLGGRAGEFNLEIFESDSDRDTFEVEATGGKVTVRGNSAIALTRGVYYYLRNATHSQITWSGEHLNLPKSFPDFPVTSIATPCKFRLYYNVCAFGYTTAFWDWKR